jgi:hypothetical protein
MTGIRYNRIEKHSNTVRLDGSAGIDSHTGWRMVIDGKEIAECAQPFKANAADIELESCSGCGVPGCGGGWVSARRVGNSVLWTPSFDPPVSTGSHGLQPGQSYLFEPVQYAEACGKGDAGQLEQLSLKEAQSLLRELLKPLKEALYVTGVEPVPHNISVFANELFAACSDGIEDVFMHPKDTPIYAIEVGLDLPAYPQSTLLIGEDPKGYVAQFIQQPQLPLWFRSARLTKLLAQYKPVSTHSP